MVLNFSCLKVAQVSSPELSQALLSANANVAYAGCIAVARRDAVVQPYQFDPELDPEGETPEELQTLQLQHDISDVFRMCCYSYYHVANG